MRLALACALSTTVLLSACAASPPTPSATISIASDALLASRTATGGMCPDSVCSSTFSVRADGSWEATVGGDVVADGSLPTSVLGELTEATATTGIPQAPPFTGTCPTAYDGAEIIYTWTSPDNVAHEASACERAIPEDDPLVIALDAAEADWVR